jgi:murein DD-endopeptidase MepM/ murein hydrolase activator NlpD
MAILRARGIAALAAAVLFLAACSGGGSADDGPGAVFIRSLPTGSAVPAASMTLTPTPEPTFTPTLEPAATALPLSPTTTPPSPPPTLAPTNEEPSSPTPAAPLGEGASAELSPESVPQGGVFVVRLRNASVEPTPVVFFSGVSHAMLLQAQLWWAVIGVAADFPPGQQLVQISTDTDGSPILTINVTDAAFPEENVELPPETSQLLTDAPAIEDENQILNSLYAGLTPERLWSGPFIMPAVGPLGDTFGYRRSFNGGPYSNHTGVDILAAEGAPVVAANTGRVVYTGAPAAGEHRRHRPWGGSVHRLPPPVADLRYPGPGRRPGRDHWRRRRDGPGDRTPPALGAHCARCARRPAALDAGGDRALKAGDS